MPPCKLAGGCKIKLEGERMKKFKGNMPDLSSGWEKIYTLEIDGETWMAFRKPQPHSKELSLIHI